MVLVDLKFFHLKQRGCLAKVPKFRLPYEVWYKNIRPAVIKRDNYKCTNCSKIVNLKNCHIDHIISGKYGSNKLSNLRTLCIPCHSLRQCNRHRRLTADAIKNKIIPPKWRQLTWEDK